MKGKTMMKLLSELGIVGLVIGLVVLGILWPLVLIWAVNTLFGFGIAYTFLNWLAAFILVLTFGKSTSSSTKN